MSAVRFEICQGKHVETVLQTSTYLNVQLENHGGLHKGAWIVQTSKRNVLKMPERHLILFSVFYTFLRHL